MKKTVAFNDGFNILFAIIHKEGGSDDAGMVVRDCLEICSNILCNSETCQRLFLDEQSVWLKVYVAAIHLVSFQNLHFGCPRDTSSLFYRILYLPNLPCFSILRYMFALVF